MNQRTKGNQFERDTAKEMRELGFEKCITSRYGSRELDDACVDLMHTDPFSLQLKAWKSAPNLHKELKKMPKDNNYNVIFHKRPNQGTVVAMTKQDFYEMIKMLKSNNVI